MALFATTTYTGDASTKEYSIGFEFLAKKHIIVTLDGSTQTLETDYTVNNTLGKITFTSAPGSGVAIKFRRVTPRETVNRYVDFTSGSSLTEQDLDNVVLYSLYIAQEILDQPLGDKAIAPLSLSDAARLLTDAYGAVSSGPTNAFEVDLTTNVDALEVGMFVSFKSHAIATYPMTLKVDSLAATPVKVGGGNPVTNAIVADRIYFCIYDGTNFELMNPSVVATLSGPLSTDLDTNGYDIEMASGSVIKDAAGDTVLQFIGTGTAVNFVEVTNANTGAPPNIQAKGTDTNIDLTIRGKGTGKVTITPNVDLGGPLTTGSSITSTDDITCVDIIASGTPTLGGNTYPTSTGSNGQVLTTDGAGALSFQNNLVDLIQTTTISGSPSTLSFTSLMSTSYDRYEIVFKDVYPSTGAVLEMEVSADNGSSWLTASNYQFSQVRHESNSGDVTDRSTGAALIDFYWTIGAAAGKGLRGTLDIYGNSTDTNMIHWNLSCINSSNYLATTVGAGAYEVSNLATSFNAWRFTLSTGTFAGGVIKVYGHR